MASAVSLLSPVITITYNASGADVNTEISIAGKQLPYMYMYVQRQTADRNRMDVT